MWKCVNCKEEIEDKYLHCWNCGKPKTQAAEAFDFTNLKTPPPFQTSEVERVKKEPPPEEKSPPASTFSRGRENSPKTEFLFERDPAVGKKPRSKIFKVIPLILWLAVLIGVAGATYYSNQKRRAFDDRIAEEAQNLNEGKDQFVFSKTASREKGQVKGKVLPLNATNREIDNLYYYLPDDLRPANLEEVKTILWLDCSSDKVWIYDDDSFGYREKCNAYLVDRNSSKIIEVQNFLGEMPPLSKKHGSGDALGKVMLDSYVSFIRENQPENERMPDRYASDSPNHHLFSKSEMIYLLLLLCVLGSIGAGLLAYLFKFSDWDID